jgi:hypothetical protein
MRGLLSAAGAGRQCAPRGAHPGLLGGPSTSPLEGSMVLVARFRSVAPLRRSSLFAALCLASAVALGDPTFERCPDSAARIYLDVAGFITVNGNVVRVADLSQAVTSLRPSPSGVCFAPVDPLSQPRPEAIAVINAIIALRLPVRFYTDGTFTERARL